MTIQAGAACSQGSLATLVGRGGDISMTLPPRQKPQVFLCSLHLPGGPGEVTPISGSPQM